MTYVIMLQGPLIGQRIDVASGFVAAGVVDGWCAQATGAYPWKSSPYSSKIKPAASYDVWVLSGKPTADSELVTAAIVKITKASPAVLTLSAADFAKFAAGNRVGIYGTGNAVVDGKAYTLANPNATNKTFELAATDLSALPADLATGSVTKAK